MPANELRFVVPPRALAAVAALAFAAPVGALQSVEARDGVAVEAVVSIKEPTRIRIENAPIVDVFGNIHSSHCGNALPGAGPAPNPAGEVVVECDRDKGEIYVRPVGEAGKPINLFVASAHRTYTLLLRRSDTPADTIVIRDKTPRAFPATPAPGPAPSHLRAMKALLVAMATDRVPPDVRVEEIARPVALWREVSFSLLRQYAGRGLVGEKYRLQNVSATPLVLAEPEFDRPDGADGTVAGVAIEAHTVAPGAATHVYVIRRGEAP